MVPDLGEFEEVEVIEILPSVGDKVEIEDALVTLESEKATMEIPSPIAGSVSEILVSLGDQVSEGQLLVRIEARRSSRDDSDKSSHSEQKSEAPSSESTELGSCDYDLIVLGGGPGGYAAAFRAADLGLRVALVEREQTLGGVCLNFGCIPSKALLHVAEVITEAKAVSNRGVHFGDPKIDVTALRAHKDGVVSKLANGLSDLAQRRKVRIYHGLGHLQGPNEISVAVEGEASLLTFSNAIIAVGSSVIDLPGLPYEDPRILDSTSALNLTDIPGRLLVVGGGVIGLEMAAVFHALGSKVSIVELTEHLLVGVDRDVVRPLQRLLSERYATIWTSTRLTRIESETDGLRIFLEGPDGSEEAVFDKALIAVGRCPNGRGFGAENAGILVDDKGFIPVDEELRSNVSHIFAVGDVVEGPMLAHKATHQGKVAAEVAAGHFGRFQPAAVPSVAYTDPEVAWVGINEEEAKKEGRSIRVEKFPWAASGRALGSGRSEGMTKLIFEADSGHILGAAIVGVGAGELIGECVLALEMGADAEDLALTIHPHPTISESIGLSAELFHGSITDLLPRREK
jgi:dihydrolipoamide dehydrogenase